MYDEFAVAESYEKGGPQVATEKTFLSARAIEIAERRNTEHDGDCKENGDWSKPGGEALGGERIPRRATSFPTRDSYVCGPRIKVRLISQSPVVASRRT